MKILIVSDTHGEDEHLDKVLIREAPFDLFVHCGDVEGREDYIQAVVDCPAYIVAGNNDYYSNLPSEETFSVGKHRFLVTHGHYYGVSWDTEKLISAVRSRNCDVVLFGHTHDPYIEKENGILCINPGSLTYPRQRGRRPSYVVLTVQSDGTLSPKLCFL